MRCEMVEITQEKCAISKGILSFRVESHGGATNSFHASNAPQLTTHIAAIKKRRTKRSNKNGEMLRRQNEQTEQMLSADYDEKCWVLFTVHCAVQ